MDNGKLVVSDFDFCYAGRRQGRLAHGARRHAVLESDPNPVAIQIDVKNAFNSLDRQQI